MTGPFDWTALHWAGLDWTGEDSSEVDWTGLDWTGLDWTVHKLLLGDSPQPLRSHASRARAARPADLQAVYVHVCVCVHVSSRVKPSRVEPSQEVDVRSREVEPR